MVVICRDTKSLPILFRVYYLGKKCAYMKTYHGWQEQKNSGRILTRLLWEKDERQIPTQPQLLSQEQTACCII